MNEKPKYKPGDMFPDFCCCGGDTWFRYRCKCCGQPYAHWPTSKQVFEFLKKCVWGIIYAAALGGCIRGCIG